MIRNTTASVLFLVLIFLASFASASQVSLGDLLLKADAFDQEPVIVSGEAIGEVLKTEDGFWINLLDSGHSLGIFSEDRQVFSPISHWGEYGVTGDQIEVSGVFYKQCLKHSTSCIHLESLKVLTKGNKKIIKISRKKVKFANWGLIICLLAAVIYFIKEKYGARA